MKKEWKKPFVRVIVLDGEDIIATSLIDSGKSITIDDGEYSKQDETDNWGRQGR